MEKLFKYLPPKQMLQIIKSHAVATIFIFIFAMLAAGAIYGKYAILLNIFTVITLFIYFSFIYGEAFNIAKKDKKNYTDEEPYLLKGFLLPIGLTIITILLYVLYYVVWRYMSVNGALTSMVAWTLNMPYIIWTYAFNDLIGLEKGIMSWYGYIIVVFTPVIFSGIGYIAGLKGFDIKEKLSKYIYEKKD